MIEIRTWLYIGKYAETKNQLHLLSHNIGAMLQLAEKVEIAGINTLYLKVDDGYPLPFDALKAAMEFILYEKNTGKKVLIACGAGISRSVVFALAALREAENLTLIEAMTSITQLYSHAMPHYALLKSIVKYYNEEESYRELLSMVMKK